MNMKNKSKVDRLNELINPETFAFERGADYGKGKPASGTEITTRKMTDTLDQMVRAAPSLAGPGSVNNAYLGEDALSKKRHDKDLQERMEEDSDLDSGIQKRIVTFVKALGDLEPEDRKKAIRKLQTDYLDKLIK